MATDRRTVLRLLGGGLLWPLLPPWVRAQPPRRLYLSARADEQGSFRVSGFTADGRPAFDLPLPARGHSFAIRRDGATAVHFARRPGDFAAVIDLASGARIREITTPDDRHFYGHGAFTADGRLLYATENDFEAGRGVIGVYDATNGYKRVGELPSHGVGPHELRLLGDGETLVIANGGIQTRPDLPRVKLNVPSMEPSLVYVNRRNGRLLEEQRLAAELHQLSIRHLAIGRDDTVAVAMQYEGPTGDHVPMIARHRRGQALQTLDGPADVVRAMEHYGGSTAVDAAGRIVAVSAPRGNLVTFWDLATGRFISHVDVADGCGVAPGTRPGEFLASSGQGGVVAVHAPSATVTPLVSDFLDAGYWDNHLIVNAT